MDFEAIRERFDLVEYIEREIPLRNGTCRCPFHDDRDPSFHVSKKFQRFKCYSGRCGVEGTIYDWLMLRRNINFREALTILCGEAELPLPDFRGPYTASALAAPQRRYRKATRGLPESSRKRIEDAEIIGQCIAQVAAVRCLNPDALWKATMNGTLSFHESGRGHGYEWAIHDSTGCNWQYRRVDGRPYHGDIKALSETGSWGSFPIMPSDSTQPGCCLLLCEGGPDYLAGVEMSLWANLYPVAMLGSAHDIHAAGVLLLNQWNYPVIIAQHGDEAGREATQRWSGQLAIPGRTIAVLECPEGEDLNDLVSELGAGDLLAWFVSLSELHDFNLSLISR